MPVVKNNNAREQSRLNFRLSPEVKARVARAATITGQDLTEFAVSTLIQKADEVIEKHGSLLLESEDYQFFLASLSESETAEPSNKSVQAAEKYRRGLRKGVKYRLAD